MLQMSRNCWVSQGNEFCCLPFKLEAQHGLIKPCCSLLWKYTFGGFYRESWVKFVHHLTLEVWKLSVLWHSPQILSAANHQRQKYSFYDWKVWGVNTGSGMKTQRYSLLCQPSTGKKLSPFFSPTRSKKPFELKGAFPLHQDLWTTTNSLARPGRGEREWGWHRISPKTLGTPTQGKVFLGESDLKPTQVPSLLLCEPLLLCLMAWYETFCLVQFRCLRMRPIIFYKILSENSWKERKCGISFLYRMYVLGMLSFATRAVLVIGWSNPSKCFL